MLTRRRTFQCGAISALLALTPLAALTQSTTGSLTIQADSVVTPVSPTLYGLMTEEINHSWDGGLYAELVQDRTVIEGPNALTHWTAVAGARVALDAANGPSGAVPRSIKVEATGATGAAPAGVQNDGYWGFPVTPQTTYTGSLFVKSAGGSLPLQIRLVNDGTGKTAAEATVTVQSGEWKRYTFTLQTRDVPATANNHLQIVTTHPGTVWLNVVSLFPPTYHDRPNGNRIDLMEKLAAMAPTFLRLPGGNFLEGRKISERFEWKKTIGPLVDRPTHTDPWRYQSSDGMGLLEMLEWCEDLKIEPVLAVYAGYSLRHEVVPSGPEMQPYIQDALDEIEYVTGSTNTRWGAERAKNGHPAPFHLQYLEIGNEDGHDPSGSYQTRYPLFFKAIREHYPNLKIIATAPVKDEHIEVLDRHFYMKHEDAYKQASHFDHMDRKGPRIFVGEWATREGTPTPNLVAALGDAAFMTGLERNSDIVVMSCYAPLFTNVNPGATQWVPDLIGYDALNSYGSPSYWAQVMFGNNVGTEVVRTDAPEASSLLFTSVTRDNTRHKLFLKVVNANATAASLHIAVKGKMKLDSHGTLISLNSDSPDATNSIEAPTKIIPVKHTVDVHGPDLTQQFPPYSINVLTLSY